MKQYNFTKYYEKRGYFMSTMIYWIIMIAVLFGFQLVVLHFKKDKEGKKVDKKSAGVVLVIVLIMALIGFFLSKII